MARTTLVLLGAAMLAASSPAHAQRPRVAAGAAASVGPDTARVGVEHPVHAFFLEGIAAFNRHDLDTFMQQFGDDLEMFAADVGWIRGKAAVRERFVGTFRQFPQVRMELRNLRVRAISPDVAVCDYEFSTYPRGSGPAYHGIGSGVYVRRGGRWEEVQEHESLVRIDAALLQAPPAAPAGAPR